MAPNSRPGRHSSPVTACCHDYSHNTAHNRYGADAGVREPRLSLGTASEVTARAATEAKIMTAFFIIDLQNGTEPKRTV